MIYWAFLDRRQTVSTCVQIQIISPQNYGYLDNIFTVLIPFVQPFPAKSWMVLILHHTNCATACGTITFFPLLQYHYLLPSFPLLTIDTPVSILVIILPHSTSTAYTLTQKSASYQMTSATAY